MIKKIKKVFLKVLLQKIKNKMINKKKLFKIVEMLVVIKPDMLKINIKNIMNQEKIKIYQINMPGKRKKYKTNMIFYFILVIELMLMSNSLMIKKILKRKIKYKMNIKKLK